MTRKTVPTKVQEIRENKSKKEAGTKSISFSQLSLYVSCPRRWYRAYVLNEAPFTASIHTVFGTAMHETLQHWLDLLYNDSVKAAEEFDSHTFLMDRLRTIFASEKDKGQNFSSPQELAEFYEDGVAILDFIKKHRKVYFDSKKVYLVGCEIPLLYKLKNNCYFKGFIDVLLYDEELDRWKIIDFKTSTSGWNIDTKKDFIKTSQLLLYQNFLSEQFGIDKDKIDIEYFILKRKINEDAEYPALRKRVQQFTPSHGSKSLKKAVRMVESFITGALTENGTFQEREYETLPSKENCKWCLFKSSCPDAV